MSKMKFNEISKLHSKKYRKIYSHFLVEGEHLIQELERSGFSDCQLYVTKDYSDFVSQFPKTIISDMQFKKISDVKSPQGVAALIPSENLESIEKKSRTIYLDGIQDPGNLGSILRTAAWFNSYSVALSEDCVDPLNSKVIRSSMGAIFSVSVTVNVTVDDMVNKYEKIAYLDLSGNDIKNDEFRSFDCFVIGNEANGVSDKIRNNSQAVPFTIEADSAIESLNAASAAAIAMYEIGRE